MSDKTKNPTLLFTLSAAFEYYDFVIYALMANYLGILFFPHEDPFVSKLQAFAVFALGYLARPLGGILLGILGDFKGRREVFIRSNYILAIATLCMALLPSYQQIGVLATIGLILLRLIQALTFATELPGAMSLISQVNLDSKTKNFSFVISGSTIGAILASSFLAIIEESFSREQILSFAWRIPFLFGAVSCFASAILRCKLPAINQPEVDKKNWLAIVFPHYKNVISFVFLIAIVSYMVVMNLFFPSLLPKFYAFKEQDVYVAISFSLVWSVFFTPIFATLTNKISRITLLQIMIVATILSSLVINYLFHTGQSKFLLIGLFIYQSLISGLLVSIFPLMVEIFPANANFTLMAICYNIAYSLMSFVPMLVTNVAQYFKNPFAVWLGLIILSMFALANLNNLYVEDGD